MAIYNILYSIHNLFRLYTILEIDANEYNDAGINFYSSIIVPYILVCINFWSNTTLSHYVVTEPLGIEINKHLQRLEAGTMFINFYFDIKKMTILFKFYVNIHMCVHYLHV